MIMSANSLTPAPSIVLPTSTAFTQPLKPIVGIFDPVETNTFQKYRVELTFTKWVIGGIPQDPQIMEGWLAKKFTEGDSEKMELRDHMLRTLDQLGVDVDEGMSIEQLREAAKKTAALQKGNTFFRDENGLYLSDYQIKAMFKECTNILYAGERWGVTKKGPKSFLAERVFVDEYRIHLGRVEPDDSWLQIGQVTGPQGPRSTLTYYDYCVQPSIAFTVSSLRDCISEQQWEEILILGQRIGLGSLRSLAHGQFKITGLEKVPNRKKFR
jgi:hypothetical protein